MQRKRPFSTFTNLALLSAGLVLLSGVASAQTEQEGQEPPPLETPASRSLPDTELPKITAALQGVTTRDVAALARALHTSDIGGSPVPGTAPNTLAPIGDLDGDGRIDVVVTALAHPAEVWMNRSPAGHWLDIQLEGTKSNRDGMGARIEVKTRSGTQTNHMTSSVGYASSSYGPVHFGLGADASAELVVIHWPSGIVQTLKDVAGDRVVKVKEAPGTASVSDRSGTVKIPARR